MIIKKNYSLKNKNTLKINTICTYYIPIHSIEDLVQLSRHKLITNEKHFILGRGANILFTKNYNGVVLHNKIKGKRIISETKNDVILEIGSGEIWNDLVLFSISYNWGGIENLIAIPGTVGAAPVQNIAAYGQNFSDIFVSLKAYNIFTQKIEVFKKSECGFQYRDSIFKHALKHSHVIISVTLKLKKNPNVNTEYWSTKYSSISQVLQKFTKKPYTIKDIGKAVISIRKSKMPNMRKFGTAGSFFKNPVVSTAKLKEIQKILPNIQYYPANDLHYSSKEDLSTMHAQEYKLAAAYILDNGMHYVDKWIGNVGLYKKHVLILVTNGKATGEEVVAFAQIIKSDFYNFCGIPLEEEVEYIT